MSRLEKIKALAASILHQAEQFEHEHEHAVSNGVSVQDSEQGKAIASTCSEMASLVTPARTWTIQTACGYAGSMALSLVLEMGLHERIAKEGTTALDELVAKTGGASRQVIKSALRQCVISHIFEEPTPENYRHNENSRMLLNENFASWVHFRTDDGLLSAAYLTRSIVGNNLQLPTEPSKMAFGLAFNTNKQMYEYYDTIDKPRGARFAKAMAGSTESGQYGMPLELSFFEKLKPGATVVDVGGGRGQNTIRLANHFPQISFIVQDRYSNADTENWSHLTPAVRERIKWQKHDFSTPEPVKGADLYMISQVLMDHQPAACREMLRHVVDAMTPDRSVLLISDYMSPTGDEGNFSPNINALNLHMMACLGRAFFTRKEWEELFASASPLLKVQEWRFAHGRVIFQLIKEWS